MRIHCLQHDPAETPGSILDWAKRRGHDASCTLLCADGPLPLLSDFDWLVVMGGPMNVYEENRHPWLKREKVFLRAAIDAGKAVIGICLGGQLIACVTGGLVTKNPLPEIGWLPVRWRKEALDDPLFACFPPEATVLEWHGDTFSKLPDGARLLAESAACAHQAFVYKERVFGFQFHLEATELLLRQFTAEFAGDLTKSPYVQSAREILAHPEYIEQNNAWLSAFLTALEERETHRR
ncbi:MAG: type 1 glutamine amidotransferase [Acidaminococcales bacterium]|nr:type 1 glutamine amidotransferase [Acidaminococcales bacterium]